MKVFLGSFPRYFLCSFGDDTSVNKAPHKVKMPQDGELQLKGLMLVTSVLYFILYNSNCF